MHSRVGLGKADPRFRLLVGSQLPLPLLTLGVTLQSPKGLAGVLWQDL